MSAGSTDRRIDKLIHALARNATVVVPGPKLASEIGVTRQKVWEWIERLRSLGVEIKGHPTSGYQLVTMPDILVPSLVHAELGESEIGHNIAHYFRTESTNTVALSLAARGAAHGTVVVAEEQTAGRGRLGRAWHSERSSGIYTSIILRPPLAPNAAPVITLMAGVAAQSAIAGATGLDADIRWPNDILVRGKKVCGILTEMSAELDRVHAVALGIGINVNHREMPAQLKEIATSLRIETRRTWSRVHLLAALLKELEKQYRVLLRPGGAAVITERWAAASTFAKDKRVRVVSYDGEFFAITAGLDPSGALRIRRDDGREECLVSGEVVEVK